MSKHLLTIALLLIVTTGYSQEHGDSTGRTKEILITTSSLTSGNYGFQYKVKIFKKSFLRFGLENIHWENRSDNPKDLTSYPTKQHSFGFSFSSGLEKRKTISNLFELSYGLNAVLSAGWDKTRTENPNISESLRDTYKSNFVSPGLAINFGVIMKIHNNFFFVAEMMPQITYLHQESYNSSTIGSMVDILKAEFNSQNASISLIYRFN